MSQSSRNTKSYGAINISSKGFINSNDTKVKNVKYPTDNGDATNKLYVDRHTHVGDIKMSVYSSDFYGWMKCDGRSLSRTTYASLFAVIGTAFGSVDGSSFNLPDCRGRVLGTIGQGSGLTNRTLGASVGAETHTLTTSEIPSHTHTSNAVGGTLGLMTANGVNTAAGGLDNTASEPNLYAAPVALSINNAGGGGSHNNMQPTVFVGNVFIYSGYEV